MSNVHSSIIIMNKLIVINDKLIHFWISFFFFPKEKKRLYVDLFSHFTCEVRRN